MMKTKTCPYCGASHKNQEFSNYCDIDCVISHRRDYNKACEELQTQEDKKRLKYLRNNPAIRGN